MGGVRATGALASALALLAFATGCGERSEPVATAPSIYPVRVHGAGDDITVLERRPERVVALAPYVRRFLEQIGASRQLVGPRLATSPFWKLDGPELVRALVRLRPDLIVAPRLSDPLDLTRAARATGAAVYVLPDTSVQDVQRAITQLGLLTEHPVTARALVRENQAAVRRLQARLRREPVVRVFVDTGFSTTLSDATLAGDAIGLARGRNVAGRTTDDGPFDLRTLARLDPQVYIATTDSGTTLRELRRDRRTRGISAVRNGRFERIHPRLLRPDATLGDTLLVIGRILHPDAFR